MPLGITASKTTYRVGEAEPPLLTATGSSGNVLWSVNYGTMVSPNEEATHLSPANVSHYADVGDPVVVTLQDLTAGTQVTLALDVYATFPFQADWGFEAEVDEDTEISQAEDNSEVIFEGDPFAVFPLRFQDREFEEYRRALAFRAAHGKSRLFYLDDNGLEELALGRFDSALTRIPHAATSFSYSFVFRCNEWVAPVNDFADQWPIFGQAMPGV